MDVRQEARNKFDRVMRVPDSVFEWVMLCSLVAPPILMIEPALTGRVRATDFYLLMGLFIGGTAVAALYYATRFVAALAIAAVAVRSRERANVRDADLPADRPDAQPRTVRPL